jgi:lysyl-tRNA synthetase class 2
LRERGLRELSLNFATFARWMHSPERWHERILGKVVSVLNPFFQIESLYRFNAKFFPRWEPRYLVYEGTLGLVRASLAAAWAEGQLPKPWVPRPAPRTEAPAGGPRTPIAAR